MAVGKAPEGASGEEEDEQGNREQKEAGLGVGGVVGEIVGTRVEQALEVGEQGGVLGAGGDGVDEAGQDGGEVLEG